MICAAIFSEKRFFKKRFPFRAASEWDESSFAAKQKHHKEPSKRPVLVLGGVQRSTNHVMMHVVVARDEGTLIPIIHQHSHARATIMADAHVAEVVV